MSTQDTPKDTEQTNDSDPFAPVRENEAAVETLTYRDDRIGAAARIALALARDDCPDVRDFEKVGIPVVRIADFTDSGGKQ